MPTIVVSVAQGPKPCCRSSWEDLGDSGRHLLHLLVSCASILIAHGLSGSATVERLWKAD